MLLPIDDSSETTSTTAVGETLMTYFLRREEALRKRWTRPLQWKGSSASRGTQSKISREQLASKHQHDSNLETAMPSTQFVEPSCNLNKQKMLLSCEGKLTAGFCWVHSSDERPGLLCAETRATMISSQERVCFSTSFESTNSELEHIPARAMKVSTCSSSRQRWRYGFSHMFFHYSTRIAK